MVEAKCATPFVPDNGTIWWRWRGSKLYPHIKAAHYCQIQLQMLVAGEWVLGRGEGVRGAPTAMHHWRRTGWARSICNTPGMRMRTPQSRWSGALAIGVHGCQSSV